MWSGAFEAEGCPGMIRILYLSQSTHDITDKQVQDILESSRRNNPVNGITGVLIHGGGLFMQVLEGPEQSTLRQYVKILDDRRHGGCKIIHIAPAHDRIFQKWSMAVIKGDPLQFRHIAQLREQRFESVQEKTFKAGMSEFLKLLNAGQPMHSAAAHSIFTGSR
jgi:hypothetical protein